MAVEVVVGISMLGTNQETVIAIIDHLAIAVKLMVALVEIKGIEVEVEVIWHQPKCQKTKSS